MNYTVEFYSDRNVEIEKLKRLARLSIKRHKKMNAIVAILLVVYVAVILYFYLKKNYYEVAFMLINLTVVLFIQLYRLFRELPKRKRYKIVARGIFIDDTLIPWKNYRGYFKDDSFVYLVFWSGEVTNAIPRFVNSEDVADVVAKYLPEIK